MKSIVNTIRETIDATDDIMAHTNCFHSWDGEVNVNVIEQGLMERLSMFEKFADKKLGVAITRKTLNETVIEIADMEEGKVIDRITLYFSIRSTVGLDDYLTIEERMTLVKTLREIKH